MCSTSVIEYPSGRRKEIDISGKIVFDSATKKDKEEKKVGEIV